jgi:hypothetical protein
VPRISLRFGRVVLTRNFKVHKHGFTRHFSVKLGVATFRLSIILEVFGFGRTSKSSRFPFIFFFLLFIVLEIKELCRLLFRHLNCRCAYFRCLVGSFSRPLLLRQFYIDYSIKYWLFLRFTLWSNINSMRSDVHFRNVWSLVWVVKWLAPLLLLNLDFCLFNLLSHFGQSVHFHLVAFFFCVSHRLFARG